MDSPRASSRQYPRIPLDSPAELQILRHLGKPCQWPQIPVRIHTASCEGVGVSLLAAPPEALLRRDKILLSLRADNAPLEVPGQVVWTSQGKLGAIDVGIRLDLAFARAVDRRIYSSWIVAGIMQLRDSLQRRSR